jgi:hypothetical protein
MNANRVNNIEHSTFNIQRSTPGGEAASALRCWTLNFECCMFATIS